MATLCFLLARRAYTLRDDCKVGPALAQQGGSQSVGLCSFLCKWHTERSGGSKNRLTEQLPWILVAFLNLCSAPSFLVTLQFPMLASWVIWLSILLSSILYLWILIINLPFLQPCLNDLLLFANKGITTDAALTEVGGNTRDHLGLENRTFKKAWKEHTCLFYKEINHLWKL